MYDDEVAECPDCGTTRLVIRKKRDHIDRYYGGPLAWWRRRMGANLYHCIFCRLQFYSRLPLAASPAEYDDVRAANMPALDRQN
jgi:DNA-directed RNA polymerase subunit RPC12/RpoP